MFIRKSNIPIFIFSITILFILSCSKSPVFDCFNSTGPITTSERSIGEFHTILLKDNINLHLKQSNKNKLVLESGSNLMPKIVTEVDENGVLRLENNNRCNWVRSFDKPINVYLEFLRLDTLEYRSIGNVTNEDTIRLDTVVIDIREGAGVIDLTVNTYKFNSNIHYGTADILSNGITAISFVYHNGAGLIDNRNLEAGNVYLETRSNNNVYVNPLNTLGVTINNIGNVYYYGNPSSIGIQGVGSGQLIKLDD